VPTVVAVVVVVVVMVAVVVVMAVVMAVMMAATMPAAGLRVAHGRERSDRERDGGNGRSEDSTGHGDFSGVDPGRPSPWGVPR